MFFHSRTAVKTSTGAASARPAWREAEAITSGEAQRRKGLVASSSAIVQGSVGRPAARAAASRPLRSKDVGHRVLVGAVDARGGRQRRELRERGDHLRGRALEEAPAAAGEERVAAEHEPVAGVGDVPPRVAGDLEDGKREPEPRHGDAVALREPVREAVDLLAGGAVHGAAPAAGQPLDPADVVAVVMGHEDGREREAAGLEEGLHGGLVAGVDHGGVAAVLGHPEIVVLEGRDGMDLHLRHFAFPFGSCTREAESIRIAA